MSDPQEQSADSPGERRGGVELPKLPRLGPSVPRYKMTLAYDGTDFHGWQKQAPIGTDSLRTVQGVVEEAVARTLWQRIHVVGASRTDAGAHALGQAAQFDAETTIPLDRLQMAINARLPQDVDLRRIEPAARDFDAIKMASAKQYRYRIHNTARRPLHHRTQVWHCFDKKLATAPMRDAAARMVGTHDFAGFACAHHGRLSTVRTIFDCRIETYEPEVQVVVTGNGFLYNMVRIIAGTLVDIGRGRFKPHRIDAILESGDRRLGGATLPAGGLWLEWIRYE